MTIITVERPDHTIERVELPGNMTSMTQRRKAETATRAAGRGNILSWEIVSKPVVKTPRGYGHCCAQWSRDQGCPIHGDAE